MGVYLKIGTADVSSFITENEYSVTTAPVYDEENSFINIYGEKVSARTGREVTISAKLYDVDDTTASALSGTLSSGSAKVTYCAPDEQSGTFETIKLSISLDRVFGGEKFWTVDLSLNGFIADDSL